MIDVFLIDSVYFVGLLVPLVPAIVLYLIFPTALVETQWNVSGVAVKAGGSTGLYLVLIALSYFKFLSPSLEYVKNLRPTYWTIDAPVTFVDDKNGWVFPSTTSSEQFNVYPFTHDFSKIDQKRYMVTLKFSEANDGQLPHNIRLIFKEGEGFIDLKKLKTHENTDMLAKHIDLTNEPPFVISPPLSGGQNKPAVAGLPRQLERDLESGDRSR
jgi:hypothetical protein